MTELAPDPDIEVPVTLPWPVICALACQARVQNTSLDALVSDALLERLRHD